MERLEDIEKLQKTLDCKDIVASERSISDRKCVTYLELISNNQKKKTEILCNAELPDMTSKTHNQNPFLRANIWSRYFHSWVIRLVTKSYKQGTLHLTDLYDLLPEFESEKLTDKLDAKWFDEIKQYPQEPSLVRATLRTIGWKPLLIGILLILSELAKFAQPLLLICLMNFFEPCSTMPIWVACLLTTGMVIVAFCSNLLYNIYFYRMAMFGLKIRLAYMGLIFRKVLRLSSRSTNTFSSGQITNLLSNDADQIEMVLYFIHYLWVAPLELALAMIFFWNFVKYIAFIAIGYTLVLLVTRATFGRLVAGILTKILQATDERVKIMSELIKSMRIVKMYCWESIFVNKIRLVRKREISQCALRSLIDCFQILLSHTYISVTLLMMYATMWSFNIQFDTRFFAIAICLLSYMRLSIIDFFNLAVRNLTQYMAVKQRIQAFLLLSESERDDRLLSQSLLELVPNTDKEQITVKNVTIKSTRVVCHLKQAQWEKNGSFSLKNIVFDARPGDLICVIGPVGAGKSSLLQTLAGEITYFEGKVRLHGSFCYVPQESWIFSSTIKENILFGKNYDHQLFQRVIHAVALESDFAQLAYGVDTLVGDQGVILSGGQKARVNLARALYRDADIYLLDDPLSAVDAKVSKHLFEKSIKSYLHDKICILVTHQVQFLLDATRILVLNDGELMESGTYAQLLDSSSLFTYLLENTHRYKQDQPPDFQKQCSIKDSNLTENESEEKTLLSPPINTETKQEGTVKWHVYVSYLQAGIGTIASFFLIILLFSAQQVVAIFSNWWLARLNDDDRHRYQIFNNCTSMSIHKNNTIWLMNDTEWNEDRNRRFYIYCMIVLVLLLITLLRVVVIELIFVNAGRVLHNKMFRRFIRFPISFFNMNPAGRILNRFTKDVTIMDNMLPLTFFDFLYCCFLVLGIIVLVCWLNPWLLIPAILAGSVMLLLRSRLARCSRDLKRLQSLTRSPVYSHLISTIQGLKVIRSYRTEHRCLTEFHSYLDNETRADYLHITVNQWAMIRFDWIALIFITCVTFLAVIIRIAQYHFTAADVALIISYVLNFTGLLQWMTRQSVEVETQMISVERILEYCSLEQEPSVRALFSRCHRSPPTNWPSQGRIIFDNVSMSHSTDEHSPLALSQISMTIDAGEKVGIVGRTGAGKSSLIQTLFRMGTLINGHIIIDNIDIASVDLNDVRRRISIIPQDPVLFMGTVRDNLDPFGDYSDAEIWCALEEAQLKTLVMKDMSNGLLSMISESGSNLSVGQKQLVCLARAILKKSKILVIDEATASVDNATDELIQQAIRNKFKQCTVLTVAHRLRTVIDSDRILVIGNGEILEFDTPRALLSNPNSYFISLIEQTGPTEVEHLLTLANTATANMKSNVQRINTGEELSSKSNETDPLIV